MLQRLSIRGKILAVVLVPILVLVITAGALVNQARLDLQAANNVSQLLSVVARGQVFNSAVRHEADMAANALSAWSDNVSLVQNSSNTLTNVLIALDDVAQTDAAIQNYVEAVRASFAGGQEIDDERTALSIADLRSTRPVTTATGEDATATDTQWPSADAIDLLAASYSAIQAEAQSQLETIPRDHPAWADASRVPFLLAQERDRTLRLLNDSLAFRESFIAAQPAVDNAWASLRSEIGRIAQFEENANLIDIMNRLERSIEELENRRDGVLARNLGTGPTAAFYFDMSGMVMDFTGDVSLVVNDPELARQLDAYWQTELLLDAMAREDYQVDVIIRSGSFAPGAAEAIRNQFALSDFVRAEARRALDDLNQGWVLPSAGVSFDASSGGYGAVRARISPGNNSQLAAIEQQNWPAQMAIEVGAILPYNNDTLRLVQSTATERQRSATITTIATAVGSALVVAASFALALLIARRIVNPLRRLTTTATAVRQELPRLVERVALPGETVDVAEVQIPVESTDEVGRLAEAFNSVNAATLAIAAEQAALRGSISEMFVNVARRDQVLLNRQLASIDEMERTEDNPDTLTKLFALDHLATRMRRNSESLLVLAGIDTGRRLRRPMPLSDVIRTASSEIELYERVQLELDVDPSMLGHSALTAAHLFAELLENATVFSDPGSPVVVQTGQEGDDYLVRISDSGIGMTAEELVEANNRVVSTAASEILGAQRLGLFVVGRIARRIGARVHIEAGEGQGTVATVTMPKSLFDLNSTDDASPYAMQTSDEAMHAPAALVNRDSSNEVVDVAPVPVRGAASVPVYQPTVIQEGESLSGRVGDASVDDLVAADAAQAPEAEEVDLEALTEGVTPSGLPTRRRRSQAAGSASSGSVPVIGLPMRATDEQLSALEADAESGFTPLVAAREVAPQTAEERAAMFRGFRSRRDDSEPTVVVEPDAESLGQAVRRGAAVLDEDGLVLGVTSQSVDSALSAQSAPVGTSQSPLISAGYADIDSAAFNASQSMAIPLLEDEEEYAPGFADPLRPIEPPPSEEQPAPVVEQTALFGETAHTEFTPQPEPVFEAADPVELAAVEEPKYPAPQLGVQSVSLDDLTSPAAAAPYAQVEPSPAENAPQAQFDVRMSAPQASHSLDDLLGPSPANADPRGGFFSKLFSRKGKGADETAATSVPAANPVAASFPVQSFDPTPTPYQEPTPSGATFVPSQEFALAEPVAPAEPAVSAESTARVSMFAPGQAFEPNTTFAPGDAGDPGQSFGGGDAFGQPGTFAPADGYGDLAPSLTPAAAAEPYNPGVLGGEPPMYTRDDLARPLGWETAGETALQAAAPEQATTYHPIVQLEPQVEEPGEEDMTSAVFSELSSLSAERPKVERTRAGLQKRRPSTAPPVEVQPLEESVEVPHKERNPEEIRSRFSNFYSGTQRARHDVEVFEQSSQGSSTE